MPKPKDKAEEREPRPPKPPGFRKFQKLLKQMVEAPPLHKERSPKRSDL